MLLIRPILAALLAALLAGLPARAGAAGDLAAAGVAEFTAAYRDWDASRFAAAAELFRRASTNEPASAVHLYWLGAAQFHLMLRLQGRPAGPADLDAAAAAQDAAVEALTLAVKSDPAHAGSHALLGTLYGMKINGSLLRGIRYGPSVARHRELALKHGASDPRVQYLLGTCQFHTARKPEALKAALQTLLRAERLFEAEDGKPAGPLDPRWGHDTCLTFIGRTFELLGQRKEAADYYRKALAMHPADHLAKEGLERVSKTR